MCHATCWIDKNMKKKSIWKMRVNISEGTVHISTTPWISLDFFLYPHASYLHVGLWRELGWQKQAEWAPAYTTSCPYHGWPRGSPFISLGFNSSSCEMESIPSISIPDHTLSSRPGVNMPISNSIWMYKHLKWKYAKQKSWCILPCLAPLSKLTPPCIFSISAYGITIVPVVQP